MPPQQRLICMIGRHEGRHEECAILIAHVYSISLPVCAHTLDSIPTNHIQSANNMSRVCRRRKQNTGCRLQAVLISAFECGFENCRVWIIDKDKTPVPKVGGPIGKDCVSHQFSFCCMDFLAVLQTESGVRLPGSESISYRVYWGAGTGNIF